MSRMSLLAGVLMLTLYVGAQDKTPTFVLHVTHVKSEHVKPTDSDCKKYPCTTRIVTVDAHSARTNYKLECEVLLLLTDQGPKFFDCEGLEAGGDYDVRRAGRSLLFPDDYPEKIPLYMIREEEERKK